MRGQLNPTTFLRKAEAALTGAQLLLKSGDTDGACSRAYYAMFDAAHAALFAAGEEDASAPIKTHNGLIAKFGQHLVLTGELPAKLGEALNAVQRFRQLADYTGEAVSAADASWAVLQAGEFVKALKENITLRKGH